MRGNELANIDPLGNLVWRLMVDLDKISDAGKKRSNAPLDLNVE